jgi:triacylglycerol lipase
MRFWSLALIIFFAGCGGGPFDDFVPEEDGGLPIDGIVFVHGINGSGSNWDTMIERFKTDGWPEDRLIARSYADAEWGCNTSNADELAGWVQELSDRGAQRIAIIAHSMGGLSSRYYLQRRNGTESVARFITLGTMHHGLLSPCLSPVSVCVWKELCEGGKFLNDLNATPATPGPTRWVSIFSKSDDIVPANSSRLDGAQNIELDGFEHDGRKGLQNTDEVYQRVKAAL